MGIPGDDRERHGDRLALGQEIQVHALRIEAPGRHARDAGAGGAEDQRALELACQRGIDRAAAPDRSLPQPPGNVDPVIEVDVVEHHLAGPDEILGPVGLDEILGRVEGQRRRVVRALHGDRHHLCARQRAVAIVGGAQRVVDADPLALGQGIESPGRATVEGPAQVGRASCTSGDLLGQHGQHAVQALDREVRPGQTGRQGEHRPGLDRRHHRVAPVLIGNRQRAAGLQDLIGLGQRRTAAVAGASGDRRRVVDVLNRRGDRQTGHVARPVGQDDLKVVGRLGFEVQGTGLQAHDPGSVDVEQGCIGAVQAPGDPPQVLVRQLGRGLVEDSLVLGRGRRGRRGDDRHHRVDGDAARGLRRAIARQIGRDGRQGRCPLPKGGEIVGRQRVGPHALLVGRQGAHLTAHRQGHSGAGFSRARQHRRLLAGVDDIVTGHHVDGR